MTVAVDTTVPTVSLKPRKDGPVRAGHPWVFSGAIANVDGEVAAGDFVRIESSTGDFRGVGSYNPHGSIAVRVLSRADEAVDEGLVQRRLNDAAELRAMLPGLGTGHRLVNGEGDSLPGVIVDRYDRFLVLQLLTAGAERLRPWILDGLMSLPDVDGIWERSAGSVRHEERLEDRVGVAAGAEPPERIEIEEDGARLQVDVRRGQKTGFYLDQSANRALVRRLARDRNVLNCFAYTGGFSVAAGRGGARHVLSVESSGPALALAQEHWANNGLDDGAAEWRADDVFDVLTHIADKGIADLVILDPPPFARHRADKDRAVRAYRDLNRRGLRALAPGGLLLTFSCSAHISRDLFEHVVATSLTGSMRLQIVSRVGPSGDHPVLAAHPEGGYLDGLLVRRLN